MVIRVHPKAAERADELGRKLLGDLSEEPPPVHGSDSAYRPDLPVDYRLGQEDMLGPLLQSQADRFGNEVARSYSDARGTITICGATYAEFLRVCRTLHDQPEVRSHVSQKTVARLVFEWACRSKRGELSRSMSGYVLENCDALVRDWHIIIPVYGLNVELAFKLGRVGFADLTEGEMRRWREYSLEHAPDRTDDINILHDRLRKRFQGRAAAHFSVRAEQEYAIERAMAEADLSISVLRLLSVGAYAPERPTTIALAGKETVARGNYIMLGTRSEFLTGEFFLNPEDMRPWLLDRGTIEDSLPAIVGHWSSLLVKSPRSAFQDVALRSMLLYSRATQYRNVSEKLIHVFSAIESLLLRNDTEPISAAAADRLAFAVGTNTQSRLDIARNLREVYAMRSKYVHHAIETIPESRELAALEAFLVNVSQLFINLRPALHKHKTKESFIEELETRKYS